VVALKADLKWKEKQAEKAVARRVAAVERRAKDELAGELDNAISESEKSHRDSMVISETKLQEELSIKITELKDEYENRLVETTQTIKNEHADTFASTEKKLRDAADREIQEEKEEVEKEEAPIEERKRHDVFVERVRTKEKEMLVTRRELEDLTGRPIRSENGRRRGDGEFSDFSGSPNRRGEIARPSTRRQRGPREG
jgi:hypothetical protein